MLKTNLILNFLIGEYFSILLCIKMYNNRISALYLYYYKYMAYILNDNRIILIIVSLNLFYYNNSAVY